MAKKNTLSDDQIKSLQLVPSKKDISAKELARAQAILMYEKKVDLPAIFEFTGLKRSALFKWRSRFIKNGLDALNDQRKVEPKKLLTKEQIKTTISMLKTETPRKFGYNTDFWSTSILAQRLKEQYNVQWKTKKPLYLLFEKASFTFHKPGQQYRNRDPKKIEEWVVNNKPTLQEYLGEPETMVFAGDEMVLSTQTTFQKIWLPVNTYPKIDVSNNKQSKSIYGFLNIKTGQEHAFKADWQNSETTCNVLEQLCRQYAGKKIVIYWDNASWHKSALVRQWLTETKHDIHLVSFPPYAPDLNPQEHVWKAGRSKITHNQFIENIDKATIKFVNYLNDTVFKYEFLGLVHA